MKYKISYEYKVKRGWFSLSDEYKGDKVLSRDTEPDAACFDEIYRETVTRHTVSSRAKVYDFVVLSVNEA